MLIQFEGVCGVKPIVVSKLVKRYGDLEAVKGMSFEVEKGEIFSILGPNGAGKTTTLEIIEGIRKKTSGKVLVFGKDVEDLDKEDRFKMRVMFQETPLFENLTVWETIVLFSKMYKIEPDGGILEKLDLEKKRKSLVKKLSGGQRRKLAFAITMIGDPDLIFLDEPTTGLDPQSRRVVWEIIKSFRASGKTVVLTTHYMEEAERLSDRVLIMNEGEVVEFGTVEEIIERSGLKSVLEYRVNGEPKRIETDDPERELERIFKTQRVERVVLRRPNLEDVFIKLTGRKLE